MAESFDFVIDDRAFRAERMGAIAQFQLSRKLAPLIPPLAPLFAQLDSKTGGVAALLEQTGPFAEALSALSDEVAEQLMVMTLATVKVETTPGTWMALWVTGSKMSMVAELNDLGKLLPIIIKVVQLNLGPFISGFLTSHGEPTTTASSGATSPTGKTGS